MIYRQVSLSKSVAPCKALVAQPGRGGPLTASCWHNRESFVPPGSGLLQTQLCDVRWLRSVSGIAHDPPSGVTSEFLCKALAAQPGRGGAHDRILLAHSGTEIQCGV